MEKKYIFFSLIKLYFMFKEVNWKINGFVLDFSLY